jgi:ATP-dependent RNA helicase DeaD
MDTEDPRDGAGGDTPTGSPVTFEDLGLRGELLQALTTLGYEEPTPIQREAVPPLRAGRDLLGQAATGTGKTAAFALPLLDRLLATGVADGAEVRERTAPLALVLVPTRELAVQVSEAVHRYGRNLGARVVPVYGGQPIGRQLGALRRGADVVVATPGRAVDHLQRGTLVLDDLRTVVLDEADEMLDMGFAEDLDTLLDACPPDRQTVLFSATMPPRIAGLAERHLRDPQRIEIGRDPGEPGAAPLVRQVAYVVQRAHKAAALGRILDVESPTAAIVFCRTRHEVDDLTETLNGRGYRAEALHGGMDQEQRDRVMGRLRAGTAELLVATDVAARGLDVEQLTHVVNYDVPSAPEAYVHRIGRVGRAGREGVAITLAEPREQRLLRNIERVTGRRLDLVPVPSVADLRSRRMELTLSTVREALADDDLDRYRVLVEALADEADLMEVALAALHLVHRATVGDDDEEEIPEVRLREDRPPRDRDGRGGPRSGRDGRREGRPDTRRADRPGRGDGEEPGRRRGPNLTRLYVSAGRDAGIRPGDLVGAIANETRVAGRDIGHIEIAERFSLVEVPSDAVDEIIDAMKRSTIKGRRVTFRRERFTPGQRR